MTAYRKSKISIVGAGPGDPELLTIKAWKAIQQADVILYDALVNPSILEEAKENSHKVYVGKRANRHRYPQEVINQMMVQMAILHGHVVRLKGGDPFIFGRGHEELEYARQFDIPVDIVPGISSCIAVPELCEVPLTRRGINTGFWVMTATTSSGQLSEDVCLAANANATVVVLMGMRKLPQIVDLFTAAGKPDLPVMIVQNGSLPNEKKISGTVRTIIDQAEAAQMGTPAIIVLGEVVKLEPEFARSALSQIELIK